MNNTMLVGRLVDTPLIDYTENNKKYTHFKLAITRPYKNIEGVYETDFIPVIVYDSMAENITTYCKKGDLIGVKGRLESRYNKNTQNTDIIVVPDRITFLSSNHTQPEQQNIQTNSLEEGEI